MNEYGIIIESQLTKVVGECQKAGLELLIKHWDEISSLPFEKNLFVGEYITPPWELLSSAWKLLDKWDVLAPLALYDKTAADMGEPEERRASEKVCGDLRQPVYYTGLMFIKKSEAGEHFWQAFVEEMGTGCRELAFLRAMHRVKPLILQVPASWLSANRSVHDNQVRPARKVGPNLVKVSIGKGRHVMCRPGEEEKTLAHYKDMMSRRRGNNG